MEATSNLILNKITEMISLETFKMSHRKSLNDFTRERILGFPHIILLQLNMLVKSLSVEIAKSLKDWAFLKTITYSKQAFSKARQRLKHTAFIALNAEFVSNFYKHAPVLLYENKYRLLSVDGSLIQLPPKDKIRDAFGYWKNDTDKGMNMARCSVLYDVLNHIVIASELNDCNSSEREMFALHLQTAHQCLSEPIRIPRLYLMDRGYPSCKLLIEIAQAEDFYVIRCKESFLKEVDAFAESAKEEAELVIPMDKQRQKTLAINGLSDIPAFISTRIVRILLSSGVYEYLLTNTDFDAEELSKLYHQRWGIEVFYYFLKQEMQLENFSSQSVEGVKQDFYAKILTANISNMLINDAQRAINKEKENAKKPSQYAYKVNRNVALGLIKEEMYRMIQVGKINQDICEQLIENIKRNKVAVVPNRSFHRPRDKRSKRKFHTHQRAGI